MTWSARLVGKSREAEPARCRHSPDPAPLAELDASLTPCRAFWADNLDALGDHLNRSD